MAHWGDTRSGAKLVEHRPGGLIAAEAESALELQREDSALVPSERKKMARNHFCSGVCVA